MGFARLRGIAVVGSVAAVVLTSLVATANAEATFASELTFSPANPTFDPYGQGTTIAGDVTVTSQGWLDFHGRSVVETPNRANLNPGTSDFSFGARIALTRGAGDWNVMQKGNFSEGQWKLSTHAAAGGSVRMSCRFSGSAGAVHVYTDNQAMPADGSWHQVTCERVGDNVRIHIDGAVVAQGFGAIGSISNIKPYLIGSKGVGAISDPDQYLGLLDDAFVRVGSAGDPEVNDPPDANLTLVGCSQLSCAFDGSTSTDPDGDPLTFSWSLGDGTQATGATVNHTYAQPGTYTVQVEARDPSDATSVASTTVTVSTVPLAPVAFRGVAGAGSNSTSVSPRVPTAVQPGDALLLFVSANRADTTLQAPAGWQSLGSRVDESMQSQLWVRVAQVGDAGATVRATSSATAKLTAQVLAYSGTDVMQPVSVAASAAQTRKTAAHTTPVVSTSPSAWAVSLWANKSASTTGWTAPASVSVRHFQGTTGSGRVTSLAADSGGPVGGASAGGLTATASQSSSTATMWTVVLSPA